MTLSEIHSDFPEGSIAIITVFVSCIQFLKGQVTFTMWFAIWAVNPLSVQWEGEMCHSAMIVEGQSGRNVVFWASMVQNGHTAVTILLTLVFSHKHIMFSQLLANKPQVSDSSSRISHRLGLVSTAFTYQCLPTNNSSIVSMQELIHVSEACKESIIYCLSHK